MNAVVAVMPPRQWAAFGLNLALSLTAAWYCFGFGQILGGVLIGTVAAVNGAVMASLLTSALVDWSGSAWRALTQRDRA